MDKTITGKVIKGHGLGKKLGFPTLNIAYNGDERGVFAGKVSVNDEFQKAAIHIGGRPTISDETLGLEVYLIDWEGEISVGTEIEVHILEKIRDTEKFENMDELRRQIEKDVEEIKKLL